MPIDVILHGNGKSLLILSKKKSTVYLRFYID